MGVLVLGRETEQHQGPRPLDILRDLDGVARLIEIAFAEDIARDGAALQRDLGILSAASPALWVLRRISSEVRDSFDGFVWIEDERIVGNVTLTRDDPFRRVWTVSNVAVHPDRRRRGIARALMLETLECVRQRGGGPLTLEVNSDNQAAYQLYRGLGFRFVEGTVTLRNTTRPAPLSFGQERARRVPESQWASLHRLAMAARTSDQQLLTPIRETDFRRSVVQQALDALISLTLGEGKTWLAIGDEDVLSGAALIQRSLYGSPTITLTLLPPGRAHAAALIDDALAACGQHRHGITVHAPNGEDEALAILTKRGFTPVRHRHRLMIDA